MRFQAAALGLFLLRTAIVESASLRHRSSHRRGSDVEIHQSAPTAAASEEMVAELTDGDPAESTEEDSKQEDPTKTYGYVQQYAPAIKVMQLGVSEGGGAAFLERGAVMRAATAAYEADFQKAFPDSEPSPYHFAHDLSAIAPGSTAPFAAQPRYLVPARMGGSQPEVSSGGFRFAQVRTRQTPEDEYIDPLSYITPATVAGGVFAPAGQLAGMPQGLYNGYNTNNAFTPGLLNDLSHGLYTSTHDASLYVGGVVAPPPPPRPDNLPPPPWIRPPNQPAVA